MSNTLPSTGSGCVSAESPFRFLVDSDTLQVEIPFEKFTYFDTILDVTFVRPSALNGSLPEHMYSYRIPCGSVKRKSRTWNPLNWNWSKAFVELTTKLED